jgi:hypothetical protein
MLIWIGIAAVLLGQPLIGFLLIVAGCLGRKS